jgi:large subunit ribosomal protein L25
MSVLKAVARKELGSKRVRHVRDGGRVPGVIYGHGQTPVSISLDQHELLTVVKHGERLLEVELDGQRENVLIKELQYDSFQQELLHIDLARVSLDEKVEITVPIVLRGTPAGAVEGGVLNQNLAQVTIECTVRNIPDEIRHSVAEMKVGDVVKLGDLTLPEGARLRTDANMIVCSVSIITEAEVAPAEEGPTQPEVIGEKKEEEGAEAAPEGAPAKEKAPKKEEK